MKGALICLLLNLFVWRFANAQQPNTLANKGSSGFPQQQSPRLVPLFKSDSVKSFSPLYLLSSSYYTSNLGFFCKKELQLESVIKFPVKFRLGSVEYTDRMEGKGSFQDNHTWHLKAGN